MDTQTDRFSVSDRAARRIAEIMASQPDSSALRVAVQGGGCSGYRYQFDLDHAAQPDDVVIERAGARVRIDTISLDFLAGAELDYTDALMGAYFAIKKPEREIVLRLRRQFFSRLSFRAAA